MIKITECPRDAMQGITPFIATGKKIEYINQLLQVGFDRLDFGSFVSEKAVPQMKDTGKVLQSLTLSKTKLLAIIANFKGALIASEFQEVDIWGYPLSVSETFQLRNTRKTIKEARADLEKINNLCLSARKELHVYLSMGFGNPYNDEWSIGTLEKNCTRLMETGIRSVGLADTVGVAQPELIASVVSKLSRNFPELELGVHLHSTPETAFAKIKEAYESGCRAFDVTIGGYGGCPMAEDKLVGNISTETLLRYLNQENIPHSLDLNALKKARAIARTVF
ncbi:MAG: hydroxymethylglutaryl-CoA lyase [Cytophagales bacterium]|nr:hydroxymethylglutaryl-CoA lyase [Cytophagales bacterium]